ncbi:MAG: hypothetical protein MJ033_02140 [Victivallaceae bacterium]|nr:hypothetical protein [Victivallaceae bacterium]
MKLKLSIDAGEIKGLAEKYKEKLGEKIHLVSVDLDDGKIIMAGEYLLHFRFDWKAELTPVVDRESNRIGLKLDRFQLSSLAARAALGVVSGLKSTESFVMKKIRESVPENPYMIFSGDTEIFFAADYVGAKFGLSFEESVSDLQITGDEIKITLG